MKNINKIALLAFSAVIVSCADQYDTTIEIPEKPVDVANQEYFNTFDVLKSYININTDSPFKFATSMTAADFTEKGKAYSTAINNFNGIDINGVYLPSEMQDESGEYDFTEVTTVGNSASEIGFTVYGGALCSNQNQPASYLNALIEPEIIFEEEESGTYVVCDFEDDDIGKAYEMTNGNTSQVINDPEGKNGKVLQVGTSESFCYYSYPKFHVKLEEGKTLADYSSISIDMYVIDNHGIWGSGIRVVINGNELNCGWGPGSFGYGSNSWSLINITLLDSSGVSGDGKIAIPDNLAGLNEFDMAIGSGSGEWHGYIDNIGFNWYKPGSETVIGKSDEEKKEIMTTELSKWITGIVSAGNGKINMWDVISEPLDDTNDTETFNWSEYLGGDVEYARTAVKMAREASDSELKLFVGNSFNQYDDIDSSIDKLTSMVNSWEEDNETVIDGYNIRLKAIYSENENDFSLNKEQITSMLEKLKDTNKAVRLSELGIIYEDETGNFIPISNLVSAQCERAAEYMEFIMSEYFRIISPENQYGISIYGMTETDGGSVFCPWTSGYERTEMYEGIVNGLKSGNTEQ